MSHAHAHGSEAHGGARSAAHGDRVGPATALDVLDVIVADDDLDSRQAVCAAIRALGHRCRGASTGLAALDEHRAHRADVIVSDWRMPGIDGMELCRRVRALDAGTYTYICFMSGHARKRDFVDAVRAGADDYLTKPIDLDDLEARLIAAARVVRAYRRLALSNVELRHDSQTYFRAARVDPLTHLANRLRLDEDLALLDAQRARYGRPISVAMCDIDQFKRYNDHHGHLAGDEALRRIAGAIRHSLRTGDHVYRYGGEEFLVILPEQTEETAAAAMERVRAAVEALAIAHAPGAARPVVTISIGLTPVDAAKDRAVRDAIARADRALYAAKAAGGDLVRAVRGEG